MCSWCMMIGWSGRLKLDINHAGRGRGRGLVWSYELNTNRNVTYPVNAWFLHCYIYIL
jgi:hypothetical protein